MARESAYGQIDSRLSPGDRLLFLSDGVVEARSKSGELYGFTRVASISREPADLIAMAAQQFGQEDDITVLRDAAKLTSQIWCNGVIPFR
jgi:serine phosphatase RsbU (regulator of sigma subunit)